MVVSGLAILFRKKTFALVAKDLFDHQATMWVAGFFLIFVGGLLAFQQTDLAFASFLGWLIMLKGITYILFPKVFTWMLSRWGHTGVVISGVIVIIIGVWLLFSGF